MNDIVPSSNDRPIPFDYSDVEMHVINLVEEAVKSDSPEYALEEGKRYIIAGRIAGMAVAQLAYELKNQWHKFSTSTPLEDFTAAYWGLSKVTLDRYIRIWEMRRSPEIPAEVKSQIEQRDLSDQSAIATTWAAGYPITEDEWKDLAQAPDNGEVLSILRDIKGIEPRSNSLTLKMDRDGTLRGYSRDRSEGFFVGYLAIEEIDDPDVARAIRRILNSANIRER